MNIQNPLTKIKNAYFRCSTPNYFSKPFLFISALDAPTPPPPFPQFTKYFLEIQHHFLENTGNSFHRADTLFLGNKKLNKERNSPKLDLKMLNCTKNGFLLRLLGNISYSACKYSLYYCELLSAPLLKIDS